MNAPVHLETSSPSGTSSLHSLVLHLVLPVLLVFSVLPVLDPDRGGMGRDANLVFTVSWFDPTMDQNRKFTLTFYPGDNSVEMYDIKMKRLFLSRNRCESVTAKDMFIGNTVTVFSRRLLIEEYGNEQTRLHIQHNHEITFAMVKPDGIENLGKILSAVEDAEFMISKAKMTKLNRAQAAIFYQEHKERDFFDDLMDYVTSGPVMAMELMRTNAVKHWRQLLGPTDPLKGRMDFPDTIRAKFGKDTTKNAAHGSDSAESADRELAFFFPSGTFQSSELTPRSAATFEDSTCCIVKPHAVKDGLIGNIVDVIQTNGFAVTGMQTFNLKYEHAEEFFEIYKGVVQDYTGMVKQLSSGLSLVMELKYESSAKESVQKLREIVGPSDIEMARSVRPNSIRAKFGKNNDENAVHCTDLPEDGKLEVEYFFKILQ